MVDIAVRSKAPHRQPQRPSRSDGVEAHGGQDIRGLCGVMGTAGAAGRHGYPVLVEGEQEGNGLGLGPVEPEAQVPRQAPETVPFQVTPEAAADFARRCAHQEGVLIGVSSGAALAAVDQKLLDIPDGSRVLTLTYDTGERYLSVEGLFS